MYVYSYINKICCNYLCAHVYTHTCISIVMSPKRVKGVRRLIPIAMNTPSTQILTPKYQFILYIREMAFFEVTGIKIQEELEISCCDRKEEHAQRMMRIYLKDTEITLNCLLLDNSRAICNSK